MITALVEIYYSGRLNRPLITFQQAGRKWSRAAVLVTALGASLYQTADLGIAPYDYLSLGLRDYTPCPYFSGAASSPMRSALYNFMVVNSDFLHRCMDTQMFFFHGFYNHSLELRRISFVWYSFWHSKTPHLLDSISYCLTNGVLFIISSSILIVQKEYRKSTDTLL